MRCWFLILFFLPIFSLAQPLPSIEDKTKGFSRTEGYMAIKAAQRIKATKQGGFSLDKSRSAIYVAGTMNFPLNTELARQLVVIIINV